MSLKRKIALTAILPLVIIGIVFLSLGKYFAIHETKLVTAHT